MDTTRPDMMELLMLLRRAIGTIDRDRSACDVLARFDAAIALSAVVPRADFDEAMELLRSFPMAGPIADQLEWRERRNAFLAKHQKP